MGLTAVNAHYDVAIVGASIAGCTAATLYGRAGLSVALIEKHSDPNAYKTACTHYMQASGTPVVERLGLTQRFEQAGAVPNVIDAWTRFGWARPDPAPDYPHPPHGWTIRREVLDPMLRDLASETPGVELLLGETVTSVIQTGGRVTGVRMRGRDGDERELRARLVVAADGRGSKVGEYAGVPARERPHGRFFYWAYYRLERTPGDRASAWFLDPDCAYIFPSDGGVALVGAMPVKQKLPEWKPDPEAALKRLYSTLPGAPSLDVERTSKIFGKVELTNTSRPAAAKGMAFAGDAALCADPVWGTGCGWAFQSAAWLADATTPALESGAGLDDALRAYRRRHRRELAAHNFLINDYSRVRKFNPVEKLMFRAATRDQWAANHLHAFASRCIQPQQALAPRAAARMVRAAVSG